MAHFRRPEDDFLFEDHLFDTDPAKLSEQWKFLNSDNEANADEKEDENENADKQPEEVKESKENESEPQNPPVENQITSNQIQRESVSLTQDIARRITQIKIEG